MRATITKKLIYQEYCEWNSTNYHYERRCPRYKELWKVASGVIKKYNIELTHYDKAALKENKHAAGCFISYKNKIFVYPPAIFNKLSIRYIDNHAVYSWDGYIDYYHCLLHELAHAILFHNGFEFELQEMDEVIVIEAIEEFFEMLSKKYNKYYTYDLFSTYSYLSSNKAFLEANFYDIKSFNETKEECKKMIIDTFKNYLTTL